MIVAAAGLALDDDAGRVGQVVGLDHYSAGQRVAALDGGLRAAQHLDLLDVPDATGAAPGRLGALDRAVDDDRDQRRRATGRRGHAFGIQTADDKAVAAVACLELAHVGKHVERALQIGML